MTQVKGKPDWHIRVSRFSRWLHKWIGAFLGLVMLVLAVTGTFVAFKKHVEYLQPASRKGGKGDITEFVPSARVAEIVLGLNLPEARKLDDINRIELRPSKRMYKVRLEQTSVWKSPKELQVDAVSGAILNNGLRGDQLWLDIHSFAVFGEWTKLVTMTLSGLALLWLTLSGYYLFAHPYWFRALKRRHLGGSKQEGASSAAD
jgi:uncharacterized iron-regulated membrane protein